MFDESAFSREALRIFREARDCARRSDKPLDSTHLMLAAFLVPCEARSILTEKRLDMGRLLAVLPIPDSEPPETVAVMYSTAAQIAQNLGSFPTTSVHLLLAVSRLPFSRAARLLDKAGLPMYALRTHAMAHLTDPRLRRAAAERLMAEGLLADPTRTGTLRTTRPPVPLPTCAVRAASRPVVTVPVRMEDDDEEVEFLATDEGRESESVREDDALGRLFIPTKTCGTHLEPEPKTKHPEESRSGRPGDPTRPPGGHPDESLGRSEAMTQPVVRGSWRYALPEVQFPTLTAIGHNLTLLAEKGLLDPLVGREADLDAVVDILSKRRSNNPLLLGDPGVGKTALVEGLASLIVSRGDDLPALSGKVIVAISMSDLLAGTGVRGSFEARLKALKEEVLAADRRVILFIDEIHTLIGSGVADGSLDAANDLKGALARGEFPCIGATTFGEYRRFIQPDPALDRRFEKVFLREPSPEEADRILAGVAPLYETHHQVRFAPDSLHAAVRLTDRFVSDRSLPAKAIDLLDRAGARARREGRTVVRREDVVQVLCGLVDLPRDLLSVSPAEGLREFERAVRARVIGQDEAVATVARVLAQNWSRFGTRRPLGSFLFVGPRGVGKRTLARAIAEALFGTAQAFLDIDLADYAEPHAISHLIGSPPGYEGHEEGGLLSDILTRRPFLVVQWRNVGQAHPSVQGLLVQILTEGTETDRRGRRMDFRNTIHVVIAEDETDTSGVHPVGFGTGSAPSPEGARTAPSPARYRKVAPGDVLAALDQIVPFRRLSADDLVAVAVRRIRLTCEEFERELGVTLCISAGTAEALASRCAEDAKTAGAVEATIAEVLDRPALDFMSERALSRGVSLRVQLRDRRVMFTVEEPS